MPDNSNQNEHNVGGEWGAKTMAFLKNVSIVLTVCLAISTMYYMRVADRLDDKNFELAEKAEHHAARALSLQEEVKRFQDNDRRFVAKIKDDNLILVSSGSNFVMPTGIGVQPVFQDARGRAVFGRGITIPDGVAVRENDTLIYSGILDVVCGAIQNVDLCADHEQLTSINVHINMGGNVNTFQTQYNAS